MINNPQDSLKCIHVAGTKGKGSTCAFLTYILREAGYKVGLYTSPHLSDFRERIRVLNAIRNTQYAIRDFEGMISQDELTKLVIRLKPTIDEYNKHSRYGPLSFFEVYTSLAFIYFKEEKVDFAVLETGLGGRLDATNVVNPLVCAIAPINYEHTQKLGNTLKEITTEKAGIIKPQTANRTPQTAIVISAPQEEEVRKVIRNKRKQVGAKLYEVGKDINFIVSATKRGGPANFFCGHGSRFKVQGLAGRYANLRIRLLGRHQVINATVAIGAIEALQFYGINIGIDSIRDGLYNTVWPGRCEVISRNPFVVLDGAQNVASSQALKETIKENFQYKKLILVLGISNDKDIKGICNELCPLADEIILTQASNPRATEPEKLVQHFEGKNAYISNNVKEAKERALHIAKKEDLILVTGSLFVVGEFRHLAGPVLGIFSPHHVARKHPSHPLND